LVVVGQFNRGKSTLMNAILGVDRLPTGVLPLTSVITSVGYGDRERVLVHWDGHGLSTEIPLDQLSEYTTEAGNPGNRMGIAVAEVQLPVELLRLGFHFIDTPGVGSAIAENTRTTRAFLPEADAAIFVTSFDSPLDQRELDLLGEVLAYVRQVFVVINKSDVVSTGQRDSVVSFVRGRLLERLPAHGPMLFAVSALQAMRAKMEGDADGLSDSGILELERALTRFLKVQKMREFLLRLADRTEGLVHKQEELLRLSEQARSSPEQHAGLSSRLRRRTDALHLELQGVMDQTKGRSVIALRKRFEQELAPWVHRVTPTLLDAARDWLLNAGWERLLVQSDELASHVSGSCRDLTSRWLGVCPRIPQDRGNRSNRIGT
jgi:GTP-binding protein EngB required for normal cell division